MPHNQTVAQGAWLCMMIACLCVGAGARPVTAEQSEILRVTVGEPTFLSDRRYDNCASLAVSRTGVVAAFYPKPETGPRYYRTSADGGVTWGPEMDSPPRHGGGCESVALRNGGVLKLVSWGGWGSGEAEFRKSPMEGEFKDGWFTLHSTFAWFNDDFTSYEVAPVQVYMPDAVTTKQPHLSCPWWPMFCGSILQLANGDLLAPMYGVFKDDIKSRVVLSRSNDRGHTWRYYATVAVQPTDPNPELPGQYIGACEPSIALLPNGQMICVMRTQLAHYPGEYRPLYVCWSDDLGKTWTKPEPTNPHLMNIRLGQRGGGLPVRPTGYPRGVQHGQWPQLAGPRQLFTSARTDDNRAVLHDQGGSKPAAGDRDRSGGDKGLADRGGTGEREPGADEADRLRVGPGGPAHCGSEGRAWAEPLHRGFLEGGYGLRHLW